MGLTAHGYPSDDCDPFHAPHCGWHWFDRCNCHVQGRALAIVDDVSRSFGADLRQIIQDHKRHD